MFKNDVFELIRQSAYHYGVPKLAAKMGLAPGTLYNKLNNDEGCSHHKLTLQDFIAILGITGDTAALQGLAGLFDHAVFPLPQMEQMGDDALLDMVNQVYVQTQCQGEKSGHYWTSDPRRLAAAGTVYIVESPINALSVETAFAHHPRVAAMAIRGVANVDNIDWSLLRGKRALIALDHTDAVNPKTGKRPGMDAAYRLYDALTAADVAARMVDMIDWEEGEDINDELQRHGEEELL